MTRWGSTIGLGLATIFLSPSALGSDVNWAGASGSFHSPPSWVGGIVPTSSDRTIFGLGSGSVVSLVANVSNLSSVVRANGSTTFDLGNSTYSLTDASTTSLIVGDQAFQTSRLSITNGVLDVQAARLGTIVNSSGGVAASSGGSVVVHSSMDVGRAGDGVARALFGGSLSVQSNLNLAVNGLGTGQAESRGAGSLIEVLGTATVASNGSARFDVADGAKAYAGSLAIGAFAASSGLVVVDGSNSLFTVAGDVTNGNLGSARVEIRNNAEIRVGGNVLAGAASGSRGDATIEGRLSATNIFVGGSASAAGGASAWTIGTNGAISANQIRIYSAGSIVQNAGNVFAQSLSGSPGSYLLNGGTLTIGQSYDHGAGPLPTSLALSSGQTFNVGGTLRVLPGATISFQGGTGTTDKLAAGGGTIVLSSGDFTIYNDDVNLAGGGSPFGTSVLLGPSMKLRAAATNRTATVSIDGSLTLSSGANLRVDGKFENLGRIKLGDIGGDALVSGSLTNKGALGGRGLVTEDLVMDPTSSLEVLVLGPGDLDRITVGHFVTFGGSLHVQFGNGFSGAVGTYDYLSYGVNLGGQFSTVDLPSLSGSLSWDLSRLYEGRLGIVLAPVPEPSAAAMLALAAICASSLQVCRRCFRFAGGRRRRPPGSSSDSIRSPSNFRRTKS